jgi:uncharacterized protein (TIGR03437 family)
MGRLTGLVMALSLVAAPLAAQRPTVGENAVVNAASFTPFGQPGHATAPGSIVSIFGSSLASDLAAASSVPLSTSLGGVSVRFNGIPAPLFFAGPSQINAQLPAALSGNTAEMVVTNAAGSSDTRTIQIAAASPAIFTTASSGMGQGWVLFANTLDIAGPTGAFEPNFRSRPAQAGDILTIFCNGLGPVNPPVPDGHNSLDQLRSTTQRPAVTIGNVTVPDGDIFFSGLAPQFVALFQINLRVPPGITPGNAVPIRVRVGNVESSPLVTMAVQ